MRLGKLRRMFLSLTELQGPLEELEGPLAELEDPLVELEGH